MSNQATHTETELTALEVESLVVELIKRNHPTASRALKRLRLNVKPRCTQDALAKAINRTKGTIKNWESPHKELLPDPSIIPQILTHLGIAEGVISRAMIVPTSLDGDLDLRLYNQTDPDIVEDTFFRRTRGQILSVLYDMCLSGNIRAIELYTALLDRCEKKLVGKKSRTVKRISPKPSFRLGEERKLLLDAQKRFHKPEPSSGSTSNVLNGSKSEPPTDSDVQPSDIPGV
jgi:DNA-binding transcriptional regulator YiaG|tara:strand:+ start:339 stop:1034 length:696 start_codon:yes stop_codon:yes gene_type:complete